MPGPRRCRAAATPLLALSEFALAAERIALHHAPSAVATIGEAAILAPSRNVVPGRVAFTVDVRDPRSETLDAMATALSEAAAEISARRHLKIALTRIWRKEPVPFDPAIVAAIDASAESLGHPRRRIISGAGHDACNLAAKVPAAMIFVPCKDGVSHNESESATQGDCAAGADVLLQTVLRLANAPRA
ncbi:M20/M25/M40 family metallo-hydrolase [Methylobacterium oryzae CBMB20]